MDGCEDHGHLARRLQTKGPWWCAPAPSGLLHIGWVLLDSCVVSELKLAQGEKSPETIKLREKVLQGCEQQIWDFFNAGGQVVIYDANNGTRERRNAVAEKFDKAGIHVIMLGIYPQVLSPLRSSWGMVESLCDNEEIIMANIRSVKISSPDASSISAWVIAPLLKL